MTTLAEKIDSWMTFYQEESIRFDQLNFESFKQGMKLEEYIQYHGYSVALEVTAKGLAQLRAQYIHDAEDALQAALQKLIGELNYCIELDTKYWIAPTKKPWTKHTDTLNAKAKVSKYQEIIEQLTRLLEKTVNYAQYAWQTNEKGQPCPCQSCVNDRIYYGPLARCGRCRQMVTDYSIEDDEILCASCKQAIGRGI